MRDIKPTNKPPQFPDEPPRMPDPKKLYSKPEKPRPTPIQPKPKFSGSKVPVAATPVAPPPNIPSPKLTAADEFRKKQPTRKISARLGDKERKLIVVFVILIAVVLGLAAYLFLPKADITLTLQTAPLLLDQDLQLKAVTEPQPGVIPASTYERQLKAEGAASVTSRQFVGGKATGTARIVNRTVDEQKIVEQSRLVTSDGTLFYMQRHAIVPPNSAFSVPIEAAEAGPSSNIAPQRLNFAALDSSAQSLVFAEVDSALTGGSGEEVAVIKAEDIERAKEEAGIAARDQVEQEIRAELQSGWVLLEESWSATMTSFATEVKEGEQKDSIPYTADVTVRVFAYQEEALQQALQGALEARLDENHMLFPEPISFTKSVESVDWEAQEANIVVRVTHTTIPAFSLATLQEKLAGRSEEEARAYLEGLPGIKGTSIETSPFWATSIPRIEKRIDIELVPDRQP